MYFTTTTTGMLSRAGRMSEVSFGVVAAWIGGMNSGC